MRKIGIHGKDLVRPLSESPFHASNMRRTQTQFPWAMNDLEHAVFSGEPICQVPGTVRRIVIDNDDPGSTPQG
jgi:hypothetical protein